MHFVFHIFYVNTPQRGFCNRRIYWPERLTDRLSRNVLPEISFLFKIIHSFQLHWNFLQIINIFCFHLTHTCYVVVHVMRVEIDDARKGKPPLHKSVTLDWKGVNTINWLSHSFHWIYVGSFHANNHGCMFFVFFFYFHVKQHFNKVLFKLFCVVIKFLLYLSNLLLLLILLTMKPQHCWIQICYIFNKSSSINKSQDWICLLF